MKNIRFFLSKNFIFLVVKFSVYLNGHVFVMKNNVSPLRLGDFINTNVPIQLQQMSF